MHADTGGYAFSVVLWDMWAVSSLGGVRSGAAAVFCLLAAVVMELHRPVSGPGSRAASSGGSAEGIFSLLLKGVVALVHLPLAVFTSFGAAAFHHHHAVMVHQPPPSHYSSTQRSA